MSDIVLFRCCILIYISISIDIDIDTPAIVAGQNGAKSRCSVYQVLALDLEGVHDLKLHHPSSSVATSNQ